MKTLIVRQNLENGASRTWRVRPSKGVVTLGKSRVADLISADAHCFGIEGAFEHRAGEWYWLHMNSGNIDQNCEIKIASGSIVTLKGSKLEFNFQEKDQDLYEKLSRETAKDATSGTKAYELEIVKFGERVLSTKVLKSGAKESLQAATARNLGGDKVTVTRRPVHIENTSEITRLRPDKAMDRESIRGTMIMGICALLCITAAVFGPHTKIEAIANLPPIPQRVTVAMVPMKLKKGTLVEKKMQQLDKQPPVAAQGNPDQKPGGRVAGMLRAVNSGRLSTLLGKVSAQAARSREVVVANGVKAGEGPSGRALAALGKVDKGGGDWSSAAVGSGVTVSTAGRGGGKGTGGFGGLSAGGTGSAGVGLVEDESEITGGLDREIIAQTIKTYLGQILYCYERQLSANPDLFGKVAVRFTIGPTGGVETQAIGDTTLKNATVEGCILKKVAAWKFPTPQGGTKVMVTYPFLFKSTN